jgi:hypothetical protein
MEQCKKNESDLSGGNKALTLQRFYEPENYNHDIPLDSISIIDRQVSNEQKQKVPSITQYSAEFFGAS